MASERQIAANRANAQKSTGPRSAAGKSKSSRNAYRHGLSSPLPLDTATSQKARALAGALTDGSNHSDAVHEFVHAQLELERIKTAREDMMATLELEEPEIHTLRRMAALDRYERYAFTRRRRALRDL